MPTSILMRVAGSKHKRYAKRPVKPFLWLSVECTTTRSARIREAAVNLPSSPSSSGTSCLGCWSTGTGSPSLPTPVRATLSRTTPNTSFGSARPRPSIYRRLRHREATAHVGCGCRQIPDFDVSAAGVWSRASVPGLSLVVLSGLLPVTLNVFRLLLIDVREIVLGARLRVQQLVELGLDGLRIPVFGALDQKRHEPRGKHGKTMPTKAFFVEEHPGEPVGHDQEERDRVPRQDAEARQRASDHFHANSHRPLDRSSNVANP